MVDPTNIGENLLLKAIITRQGKRISYSQAEFRDPQNDQLIVCGVHTKLFKEKQAPINEADFDWDWIVNFTILERAC